MALLCRCIPQPWWHYLHYLLTCDWDVWVGLGGVFYAHDASLPGSALSCTASSQLCQGGRGGHTAAGQWRLHDYNQRIPERALVSIAHKYSLNTFNDKGKRWWVYNEFVTARSHRVMGRVNHQDAVEPRNNNFIHGWNQIGYILGCS